MSLYNIVVSSNESTVVAEYVAEYLCSNSYQSEANLEQDFINRLLEQGYEYIRISNEAGLIANLRCQIERLNDYKFYDSEWERFCNEYLTNKNEGIVNKTRKIQVDERHSFRLDNGLTKNIA